MLKSGKVRLWSLAPTKDYSDPCDAVRDYRLRWQIEERYKQIMQRDKIDSKRKYAPLIKAKDAVLIDSSMFLFVESIRTASFALIKGAYFLIL